MSTKVQWGRSLEEGHYLLMKTRSPAEKDPPHHVPPSPLAPPHGAGARLIPLLGSVMLLEGVDLKLEKLSWTNCLALHI